MSNSATGRPTTAERPRTTARAPSSDGSEGCRSSSITAAAVAGTKNVSPATSEPLVIWVRSVDVLTGIDLFGDSLRIEPGRERPLHHHGLNVRIVDNARHRHQRHRWWSRHGATGESRRSRRAALHSWRSARHTGRPGSSPSMRTMAHVGVVLRSRSFEARALTCSRIAAAIRPAVQHASGAHPNSTMPRNLPKITSERRLTCATSWLARSKCFCASARSLSERALTLDVEGGTLCGRPRAQRRAADIAQRVWIANVRELNG